MLPARHRMRRSPDFREAVRSGRRAGGGTVVVHLLPATAADGSGEVARDTGGGAGRADRRPQGELMTGPARVGLVVSKAVGGAVVRNRVSRRLRHLMTDRLVDLPSGTRVVLRATPGAAGASSTDLGADLDRGLRSALRGRRPSGAR